MLTSCVGLGNVQHCYRGSNVRLCSKEQMSQQLLTKKFLFSQKKRVMQCYSVKRRVEKAEDGANSMEQVQVWMKPVLCIWRDNFNGKQTLWFNKSKNSTWGWAKETNHQPEQPEWVNTPWNAHRITYRSSAIGKKRTFSLVRTNIFLSEIIVTCR